MTVPFHDGLLSQFAGWEHLAEQDWHAYRHQYGNIGRMDLILCAEGERPGQNIDVGRRL